VTDLPRDPDSSGDRGSRPGSTEESTPRWVKVFGLVLVLLMLIALLTGHGPGRHMPFNHHLDKHTPAAARAQ